MPPEESVSLDQLPHREQALLLTSAFRGPGEGVAHGVREAPAGSHPAESAGFLPQSLLVELMSQTAGLILPSGTGVAFVAGINRMQLLQAARTGQRVDVTARLERRLGPLFVFDCRAEATGELLASGSIVLRAL